MNTGRSPDAASERRQAFTPASAEGVEAPAAPPAIGPETAPQAIEKMEFAPENGAVPEASDDVSRLAGPHKTASAQDSPDEACAPAVVGPPRSGRATDAPPCDGPETAPQAPEKIEFRARKRHEPGPARSDRGGVSACGRPHVPPRGAGAIPAAGEPNGHSGPAMERPEPAAVVLVADLGAPGGFRRVNVRMLLNGVAAC